jgi:hypothetical protein
MKWSIVEVHYEGETRKWRAVLMNELSVIIKERTFSTLVDAEIYVRNESV